MKMKKGIIGAVVFALLSTVVFADAKSDIEKGIELHNAVRKEGIVTAEKGAELLKPYIKENAIACAYYGSIQTLIAGAISEKNPIKALEYLQMGGDYLDEAVELEPDNAIVRLIRLENGIEVSRTSPIKRYSTIKKDVKWFLDDGNISSADSEIQAEAYLYCGYYMIDAGDLDYALELFEECIALNPKSESAKAANKMLDKYTE